MKILQITNLKISFSQKKLLFTTSKFNYAVNGVTFDVTCGETLGIVGESGSGKSTIARAIVGLSPITGGKIIYNDKYDLTLASTKDWKDYYKHIQLIFQDPLASLNPLMNIFEIIAEPLKNWHC